MVDPQDTFKMGAGHARKTYYMIRGWGFEPDDISTTSKKERVPGN